MIVVNGKYPYKAYKVKHLVSSKGTPYIKLTLGDYNNFTKKTEAYFSITIFQDLPNFNDGDKYNITKIQSIECRKKQYDDGQIVDFYNMVCEIEVLDENGNVTEEVKNDNVNFVDLSNDVSNLDGDFDNASFDIMDDDIQF